MTEGVSQEHMEAEAEGRRGLATHLRDMILGGQDGVVNVLGLVLGLTASGADAHVIVVGGLAALLAESIAMGGVQYTSSTADVDHYRSELERERREVREMPDEERAEVRQIFRARGLRGDLLEAVVKEITSDPERWVQVMMKDELDLTEPAGAGLVQRAILVGISCAVGSAIPILPYLVLPLSSAPVAAVGLSAVALFAVGAYKAVTFIGSWWRSGLQMLAIGLVSAFAGYLIGVALRVGP